MSRRPWGCAVLPPETIGSYDNDTREYRVTFRAPLIASAFVELRLPIPANGLRQRAEAMAYYTNDKADAIGTARAMVASATPYSLTGTEEPANVPA